MRVKGKTTDFSNVETGFKYISEVWNATNIWPQICFQVHQKSKSVDLYQR